MSRYTWLLDNGHGGIINGKYSTCPNWTYDKPELWSKMFVHGTTPIYEGCFNRRIVDQISRKLLLAGIDAITIVPENDDISLQDRVTRVNKIHDENKNCIFVSVHGNAFNGKVRGFEIFTSVGDTDADPVAEVFAKNIEKRFQAQKMRWDLTDGDLDKEAHFYVLTKTKCPAVLTENLFFDNLTDAKIMMSAEGQEKIATAHFEAILEIEKKGIL